MAAACNDGFIRLFSNTESFLMCTLQGVFGSPLCLDVSKDSSLLIAGYEDDSFLIYQMAFSPNGIISALPQARGLWHKSFVCQVRFDNYLMDFIQEARLQTQKAKLEGLKDLAVNVNQEPPSLLRKMSSTKSMGKQSADTTTVYRIVTGGEDS